MTTSSSNPFSIGCTMVGVLVLLVALLVHALTENFTALYYFSLGMFVIGFLVNTSETE
jgi:uncharacterized membrane protein YGL010W